jgi:nucleoside-diphosphate-sugar epimerase
VSGPHRRPDACGRRQTVSVGFMRTVLVTGASGFLGSRLVARLATGSRVVALSRQRVEGAATTVTGSFTSAADLAALDVHPIDTVVHLAATTGGSSEEDALDINVSGTRRLLRYCVDRGITRFVLASSIAAVGCLSSDFLPRELPIPDDHPCDAVDAYGLSKALMEEVVYFFARQRPGLDITMFRIGAVQPDSTQAVEEPWLATVTAPFVGFGGIVARDVVDALARAAGQGAGPGVHRMNLVASQARSPIPTADALRQVLGDRVDQVDLSFYDQPGNEHAGLYATDELRRSYGFTASIDPATMRPSVRP